VAVDPVGAGAAGNGELAARSEWAVGGKAVGVGDEVPQAGVAVAVGGDAGKAVAVLDGVAAGAARPAVVELLE